MRPPLIDLGNLITKHNSLMIVGDVMTVGNDNSIEIKIFKTNIYYLHDSDLQSKVSYKARMRIMAEGHRWLAARKIKAFYEVVEGFDFETGVRALIQTSGVGKLSPNILLMGYKGDWQTCPKKDLKSYFNVLQ